MNDVPNTYSYMVVGFTVILGGTILYVITLINRMKKVLNQISAYAHEIERRRSIEE